MNILKPGDLSRANASRRFECDACGCEFVADRLEYREATDCRNGRYLRIACPTCGRDVALYPEDEKGVRE